MFRINAHVTTNLLILPFASVAQRIKIFFLSIAVIFGFLDSGWLMLMLLASARAEELYSSLVVFKDYIF